MAEMERQASNMHSAKEGLGYDLHSPLPLPYALERVEAKGAVSALPHTSAQGRREVSLPLPLCALA